MERRGGLTSPAVRRAFLAVPREVFVPEAAARDGLEAVYRDEVIVTARDERETPISSSSQPSMMAPMLEQLRLDEGQRVLEIGAGTGYNAALLAELVGATGQIVSVELDPAIARGARRALRECGTRARVVQGDGREGWQKAAPYDRIIVTASAAEVPPAWFSQLAEGGLLELPLRFAGGRIQAVVTFEKRSDRLRSVAVLPGGFMPLRGPGIPSVTQAASQLSAFEHVDGRHQRLVHLNGEALGRLSHSARRKLLSLALSEPRTRPLGLRAKPWHLNLYLTLEAPATQFVGGWPFSGVIASGGQSLALLGGRRTVTRIDAHGDPEAEHLLLDFVDRWKALGRPGQSDLELEVDFINGTSQVRWRWRSA